jgi:putative ABC transport system permease protein
MSTLAHPSTPAGRRDSGLAGRRAIIRWARRMLGREWRQQILVVLLLAVAVTAAIGSITIVRNSGAVADNAAEFGTADQIATLSGSDPTKLREALDYIKKSWGTVDIIGHRSVAIPGGVEKLDYRAQDPNGAYGAVLLALRQGRYPTSSHEVAVTDGVADSLRLEIGSTLALDGVRRKVVGIVENPRKLSDEFALVSPASAYTSDFVDVLTDSNNGWAGTDQGEPLDRNSAFQSNMIRGNDNGGADTLALFSVTTVFVLLASLVAAAGFAVVAQRRLRQLGMLAAIGATQKHVRLVLLTNGAAVGAIAALIGTIAGVAMWVLLTPTLESWLDHRISGLSLPWGLIAMVVVLALLGATAAAWWPGRAVARLPVMLALSGRPPKPRPVRHSAVAAAALIAAGVGALALSNRDRPLLIIAGLLATILGSLLLGPPAIRTFSALAGRVSVTPRLALRDLARYQARSGAALAAVTLALGIAAAVVVVASAEDGKRTSAPPTLSNRQIRVYLGPSQARELTPVDASAQLGRLTAGARQIAAQLDQATVMPLRKALDPGAPEGLIENTRVLNGVEVTTRFDSDRGTSYRGQSQLYVATPAVLEYLGIDPNSIDPSTDFLVDRSVAVSQLVIPSMTSRTEMHLTNVQRIEVGQHLFGTDHADKPPYFITLNGLRRHGWKQIPAGWLVESSHPLTSKQIADARDRAADAGLTIEVQHKRSSLPTVMAVATAAGAVLALAILAMTVGLIRSESAGDLRTLTATGATSRIRRTLTAVTAGGLALLGAVLGVAGAYVALAALYHDDLGYLSHVPVLYLALAVVGVPLCATAAGWLLAGREPPAIARSVIA